MIKQIYFNVAQSAEHCLIRTVKSFREFERLYCMKCGTLLSLIHVYIRPDLHRLLSVIALVLSCSEVDIV